MEPEFNLCEENWICLLGKNGAVSELSLPEALIHAHEYVDIRGEMPAQDIAVLRLLLAVLHTVFSRVNAAGEEAPIERPKDARNRWETLWRLGKLPEEPIRNYLNEWRDRFWLFHEERPFWQVNEAELGTKYEAAKLNGEISESSNKVRLFSAYSGESKQELSCAQAARWLLYINGYDDTSAKPKGKELPSPGAGWLGKLGLITAVGKNLFETLMLNLTLLKDGTELWEEEDFPVWEREKPRAGERTEIALPENQAELLTLQSRRLLLVRNKEKVTGVRVLGGDFFAKEFAFSEQMTVWRAVKEKKDRPPVFQPRRHDPAKQMWRDFGAVFPSDRNQGKEAVRNPGVVCWNEEITRMLGRKELVRFRVTSMHYGDKDFFVDDSFADQLSFHAQLLTEAGAEWRERIAGEVERCRKLSEVIGYFAQDLDKAGGGDGKPEIAEKARAAFYERVDIPFRGWLQRIDPETGGEQAEQITDLWLEEERRIAKRLGRELVAEAGDRAYMGRKRKEKIKGADAEIVYTAPGAYERLLRNIRRLLGDTRGEGIRDTGEETVGTGA
ncbi:type I-E CRISPR-associated protein Cse1/CasA [Lachnoclostridium sp. Marseille-P6806]|uniref:type I-E CRISPR-associated protein Cse1/CasA n=1 Tax=Lachnoclostridium sp. Marseille-P6806 TaxID=2364793 RepID=UPI00102FA832|nr:type I-E CRISPR-associated protein Cse1/CasA [Lachnoclostridium sp. Marseille-P6806]